MILSEQIAADLLRIKAVFLRPNDPFTWASGIKSPIYCDNRLTLSDVAVREDVENGLAETIRQYYPEAEVLRGTSTARSGAKDHGRQNQIEGKLIPGQRVVVVEDLISTAGSCLEVVEVLREAGAEVLGIVSIFTYGMKKGLNRLAEAKVENHSLSNLDVLAEVAVKEGYISAQEKLELIQFRDNL